MQSNIINFHSEALDFILKNESSVIRWLKNVAKEEGREIQNIGYVFCSDNYLLEINKKYLTHDFFTDIITFPLRNNPLEANVFISIDRVKENAQLYNQSFEDELDRVIVHGLLHLIGYDDKNKSDETQMRQKEDFYLSKRNYS